MRTASSRAGGAPQEALPSFRKLSDILAPLKPEHRRVVLDELDKGVINESLNAIPRNTPLQKTEVETLKGQVKVRRYQDFQIGDTAEFQKWLQDRAVQAEDEQFLREGISPERQEELTADPQRFRRLALAYRQQHQEKATRKRQGKRGEVQVSAAKNTADDQGSAAGTPPDATTSNRQPTE